MIRHINPTKLNERGVTIVELLVVMIVSLILTGVITVFALNYWASSASLETSQEALVSRLNSGDYLREALDAASGLINQNDLNDANPGKPDPADVTGKHWLPIHAVPASIAMPAKGAISPVIYFNRPSINTSKNIIMNGAIAYQDDVVLYLNGTTKQLLARTISNQSASSNRAKTTCPAALATSSCPADIIVADNVSAITMRYFSRSGNTIDYTSITDPVSGAYIGPDFSSVEVVEFTVKFFTKARLRNGADSTNQTVIRVALRNY